MSTFQADFARIAQLQTRLKASQMQIEAARSQIISAKSKLSGQSGFGLSAVKAAIQQEVKTTAEQRETAGRMRAFMGVVVDRTSQHENSAAGRLESTDIKKTIELFISRLRKILLFVGAGALGIGLTNLLKELMEWIQKPPVSEKPGHGGDSGNGESLNSNDNNSNESSENDGNQNVFDPSKVGMISMEKNGSAYHYYNVSPLDQNSPIYKDYQLDPSNTIGRSGCGLVAMAICLKYFDGKNYTAEDMAQWWENDPYHWTKWHKAGFFDQGNIGADNVLPRAIEQLKAGYPSIIQITNGSLTHYLVVKGFREGCDINNLQYSDILVQDPGVPTMNWTLQDSINNTSHGNNGWAGQSYLSGQIITMS